MYVDWYIIIGPLQDPVTWYKITYTDEQVAQWDLQNNAPVFVLEVPLCNLLTSICNFVPCDRVLQRAYLDVDLLSGACVAIEKNSPDNACLSNSNMYFWTASWKTSHSCSKTACRAQGRECNNTIAHCVFSTLDKIWPDSSFPFKNDCNRSLKFCFLEKCKAKNNPWVSSISAVQLELSQTA